MIPCKRKRYSSSDFAEARRVVVLAFWAKNLDCGSCLTAGVNLFFYNHSSTANLELLFSAAKESYHLILNLRTRTGCSF
jgi:hypothetical protein